MKFPKYIITADGYIGAFRFVERAENVEFPVYRFDSGVRNADNWEIENGVETYDEAVRIAKERKEMKRK